MPERYYYRRLPLAERDPLVVETLAHDRVTVPPGGYIRADLLTGMSSEVRERFEAAVKDSRLRLPEADDAALVIHAGAGARQVGQEQEPRTPLRHLNAVLPTANPPKVAVVLRGAWPEAERRRLQENADLPVLLVERFEDVPGDAALVVELPADPDPLPGRPFNIPQGWLDHLLGLDEVILPFPEASEIADLRKEDRGLAAAVYYGPGQGSIQAPIPRVWIVLTVHNRADIASECVEALGRCTRYPSWGLVVVNDASDPSEMNVLGDALSWTAPPLGCRHIDLPENVGYREAVEAGIAQVIDEADFVLLLNSDVLVTRGWLTEMVRAAQATGAQLVNPLCNDAACISLPFQGQGNTTAPRVRGGLSYQDIGLAVRAGVPTYPPAITSVGNCLLISAEAWRRHGPFHPAYGRGYGEECELWAKVLKGGGRAVVADNAFVYHQSHATFGAQAQTLEREGVRIFRERNGAFYDRIAPEIALWPRRTAPARQRVESLKLQRLPVQFLAVDVGPWGGASVLVSLTHHLRALGLAAQLGHLQPSTGDAPMAFSSLRHRDEGALAAEFAKASGWSDGILVATHWSTGQLARRVAEANRGVLPVAFWQDIESRFLTAEGKQHLPDEIFLPYVEIRRRIANSRWVADEGRREFGLEDFETIPVGIDTRLFHPRPERRGRAGKLRILAMWRPQTPRRGHVLLREVYRQAREHFGDRVSLELYGWTEQAPPFIDVHHGRLAPAKVAELMASVDVFVEPSLWQGFGLPGAEAMASGCALVSADTGGVWEYASRDSAVIVLHEELAKALISTCEDESALRDLQMAGPEVMGEFDWRKIAARWALALCRFWQDAHPDGRRWDLQRIVDAAWAAGGDRR